MAKTELAKVAYFCMEYGFDKKFPIYAGGLGILAADHLKSARDLSVPMVGIGLLYREGYTKQEIDENGWPKDQIAYYDRDFLEDTGEQITVPVRGCNIPCRIWRTTHFGNVPLLLLDTDVPGSDFWWVTKRLYGGVEQDRISQEIVLGIGGIKALRQLGIETEVYHFNEGHAVLAGIELIKEKMDRGASFDEAWEKTRQEVVFTTHTPVPAGNETHEHGILQYMGAYNGLNYEQMRCIGGDPFSMTIAGLRLASIANGVAKMHGITARNMWNDIDNTAPIIAITNGVHVGTWQDRRIAKAKNPDDLWSAHQECKLELIRTIQQRSSVMFNPDKLLVGFARRVAAYKRTDLLFHHPNVIEPLLESGEIQLVFAGKSHPHDEAGKSIIAKLVALSRQFPNSVVFLRDYDVELGKIVTRGCDVWLNNPQRPLEASGTSGIKAAMNGVLNLSVLDGWWPEGCWHGSNGWQIGGGYEGPGQTHKDLVSLYDVLINEVMVAYYEQRLHWLNMMKNSINMAINRFSSDRMLKEYHNLMYLPLASKIRCAKELELTLV
jgi:starch phosphorylase